MSDKTGYTGAPDVINTYGAGGASIDVKASPNAFGAGLFDALHGLGQVGFEAAMKKQALANSLEHDRLAIDTSRKFAEAWSDYGKLEGDAAVKGLGAYQDRLKSIWEKAIENAPNDDVRKMLANTTINGVERYMSHGANYSDTQFRHWHEKLHSDAVSETKNQAVMSRNQTPAEIERIIENGPDGVGGMKSVRERVLQKFGKDTDLNSPEVRNVIEGEVKKERGDAVYRVVSELAAENKVDHAEEVFKHFKDLMDANDVSKTENMLRPKILDRDAVRLADQRRPVLPPGSIPTTDAERERQGLMSRPSRENAQRLGLTPAQAGAAQGVKYHGGKFSSEVEGAIDRAAKATGVDPEMMRVFASIESGGRKGEITGRYKGLFQLSDEEMSKHGGGNIYNANDNAMAAAKKIKGDSEYFRLHTGHDATPFDLYMIHQQGIAGHPAHVNNPNGIAWENIRKYYKSDDIAKAAIWGNIPTDQKRNFPGGVDSVTSGQFEDMWRAKFNRLAGSPAATAPAGTAGQHPQTQPQITPDSPLSPQYASRQARKESDREYAYRMSGGNHELENRTYAILQQRAHDSENNMAAAHEKITDSMRSLDYLAQNAVPDLTLEKAGINEEYIRSVYHNNPEKADHLIETFNIQKENANRLKSLTFASPQEVNDYLHEVESGHGIKSQIERNKKGREPSGPMAVGARPDSADDMVRFAEVHGKARATANAWAQIRAENLSKDPAQFSILNGDKNVTAALERMGSADPEEAARGRQDYAAAQIAVQRKMGVPDDSIRIMPKKNAMTAARSIIDARNPKEQMEVIKASYGPYWSRAFSDMVNIGGLPAKYESLEYLDDINAHILSNQLKQEIAAGKEHEKGMTEALGEGADKISIKKVIDNNIESNQTIHDLMENISRRGSNASTRGKEIIDSIKALAYGRRLGAGGSPGEDPVTAATNAVNAFTANHIFTPDKALIPKTNADEIQRTMNAVAGSFSQNDILVPAAASGVNGAPSADDYLTRSRATGWWVNTPGGDGVEFRDMFGKTMVRKDGKPIRVMFDNLGEHAATVREYEAPSAEFTPPSFTSP